MRTVVIDGTYYMVVPVPGWAGGYALLPYTRIYFSKNRIFLRWRGKWNKITEGERKFFGPMSWRTSTGKYPLLGRFEGWVRFGESDYNGDITLWAWEKMPTSK
jgi:hypothetical protein